MIQKTRFELQKKYKTVQKIEQLLQITLCLSNLMLTGNATPFLHNGIMNVDYNEENNFDYGEGKVGITNRNDIGFLFWDTNPKMTQEAGLGSRLKTPVLPIWVSDPTRDNYSGHVTCNDQSEASIFR